MNYVHQIVICDSIALMPCLEAAESPCQVQYSPTVPWLVSVKKG